MRIEYGFAEIKINDEKYELKPTLSNIKNIGSKKHIVDCFSILSYKPFHYITSFRVATEILQACGLPDKITGGTVFSERQNKVIINKGILPLTDVFILAEHCLRHGVCGVIEIEDKDSEKKGDPLTEFDAHKYIMDAVEFLGVSLEKAEEMTMTQFVLLAKAKSDSAISRQKDENGNPVKTEEQKAQENDDALAWYYSKVNQVNSKHKEEK